MGTVLPFGIPWEAPAVDKKPTVPDIIMMAGGAVCLLFSFFAFWKFGSSSESAWGQFAFPLATYVALFGHHRGRLDRAHEVRQRELP